MHVAWADDNSCTYQIAAARWRKYLCDERPHIGMHIKSTNLSKKELVTRPVLLRGPELNFRHEVDLKFNFAILANIHKRSRKSNFVPKVQLRANPIFGLADLSESKAVILLFWTGTENSKFQPAHGYNGTKFPTYIGWHQISVLCSCSGFVRRANRAAYSGLKLGVNRNRRTGE